VIANRGRWEGGEWDWDWYWDWVEDLSNTEAAELLELEGVLQGIKPNLQQSDRRRWIAESSGNFSVQSCYTVIAAGNHSNMLDPNPVTVLNR
jgi:hypothetical protein